MRLIGPILLLAFTLTAQSAQLLINVGAAPNDGTGDPFRSSMVKVNTNFWHLFNATAALSTNYLAKSAGIGTLSNSIIYDTGTAIGIGTTDPALGTLTVSGNGTNGAGSGVRIGLFDTEANGRDWYLMTGGTNGTPVFVPGNFYIRDRTAGLNRVTVGTNGYVGIGTTAEPPAAMLDVLDPSGGGIRIRRETLGALPTVVIASSSSGLIGTFSAHPMSIWANSLERVTIDTDGRVGIGATSPDASAKLQVNSVTSGVLLPRMTKAQRDAISAPADGLLLYQTDNTAGVKARVAGAWVSLNTTADP